MGFFVKKKQFLHQNKNFQAKKSQPWNSKPFKNISNLDPSDTAHTPGGRNTVDKSERRGLMYDRGLGSEASLKTRVHR